MAFQQLYYTSCEQGLSGFAGFQFNATTPGVGSDVLREVEQLTAYEPPPGLSYDATPVDIVNCPTNLCFSPGSSAVIANVVFVGTDFSNRFGNYFAHAIASDHLQHDLGSLLPIELWGAEFWSNRTVDTTELPELPAPPPRGDLDRAELEGFLRRGAQEHLPALLTAAWAAIAVQDRSVVLVTRDTDDVARLIAAVSYLLPQALALQMSFATYHHRPSYSRLHVMGTTPDITLDISAGALESFYLFDFPGERFTPVEAHPLAMLLCDVGVVRAEQLLADAAGLIDVEGSSIDDWHPVVAAAAMLQGHPLAQSGLDVVLAWFAVAASGIRPEAAGRLGTLLADPTGTDERRLDHVIRGARSAGLRELLDRTERRLVDVHLDKLERDMAIALPSERIASPNALAHAQRSCEELLKTIDTSFLVEVLAWASAMGVSIRSELLVSTGKGLGLWLGRDGGDERLTELFSREPLLLQGALQYLEGLAEQEPARVETVLDAGLVPAQDLGRYRRLHALQLVGEAQRDPDRKATVLGQIVDLDLRSSDTSAPDHRVLKRLWPDGSWTPQEARELLHQLSDEQTRAGVLPEWFDNALGGPPDDELLLLWRDVGAHPVRARFGPRRQEEIARAQRVLEPLDRASKLSTNKLAAALPEVVESYALLPDALRESAGQPLVAALHRLAPGPLGRLLLDAPVTVIDQYARRMVGLLGKRTNRPLAPQLILVLFELRSRRKNAQAQVLEEQLLSPTVPTWSDRDVRQVHAQLQARNPRAAEKFDKWLSQQRQARPPSGARGLLRKLLGPAD